MELEGTGTWCGFPGQRENSPANGVSEGYLGEIGYFFKITSFPSFCRLMMGPPPSEADRPLWSSTSPWAPPPKNPILEWGREQY